MVTIYDGVTTHARTEPMENRFSYQVRNWLVDLDALPTMPRGLRWAAAFRSSDHVGDPTQSIKANIEQVLLAEGIDVSGGRILMLANARALGHVFNPISVHWAFDRHGSLAAVVAEVHNTYGGRHAYVLRPDSDGADIVEKRLYVSPFYGVDGRYTIRVSPPGEHIAVSITLTPEAGAPFTATLRMTRKPETSPTHAALATATRSLRTSGLIRFQGVKLWARKLPVQPRPTTQPEPTTQPGPTTELQEVAR